MGKNEKRIFKMKKNLFVSMLAFGLAATLSACGDDSPTDPGPVVPPSGLSSAVVPTSSDAGIGGGGVVQTPYAMQLAAANPTKTVEWYSTWKGTYYKTYIEEAALYPVLATDWGSVFGTLVAQGLYPARIVWDTSNDQYCVIDESTNSYKKRGCTVSEGIGYGMLITLFMDDMEAFKGLWYYNRGYRAYEGKDLMPWRTGTYSFESLGSNANKSSATDADLDIATALVLAYYKTGDMQYLNDALLVMTAIWDNEISPDLMIYSGNTPTWKTATSAYNLSYFSPIAIKLFALVDGAHNWNGVLDKMYTYMIGVQSKGPGLVPDWSDANGTPVDPKNGSATNTYWRFFHEAVRVPWRIAWDYYWTQDPRALQVLSGINQFIVTQTGGDPSKLETTAGAHIYSAVTGMPDSTLNKANLQSHWHGAWCLSGMANNQAWMDACTTAFNERSIAGFNYFPHILMTMYSELLNGFFQKPTLLPL